MGKTFPHGSAIRVVWPPYLGFLDHPRADVRRSQALLEDIMAGARNEKPLDRLSDGKGEAATSSAIDCRLSQSLPRSPF